MTFLGETGSEPKCVDYGGGTSVHWWSPDAADGDPCLCGDRTAKAHHEPDDEATA